MRKLGLSMYLARRAERWLSRKKWEGLYVRHLQMWLPQNELKRNSPTSLAKILSNYVWGYVIINLCAHKRRLNQMIPFKYVTFDDVEAWREVIVTSTVLPSQGILIFDEFYQLSTESGNLKDTSVRKKYLSLWKSLLKKRVLPFYPDSRVLSHSK